MTTREEALAYGLSFPNTYQEVPFHEDIKQMIAESYHILTDSPTARIYEAVKKIPKGRVATYGQVAEIVRFTPSACNTQPWITKSTGREFGKKQR